jgi:hypothetical protein
MYTKLKKWRDAWYADRLASPKLFEIKESIRNNRLSPPKQSAMGRPLIK